MPPAAAAPDKNTLGSVQKTGNMLIIPAWAMHNPTITMMGDGSDATSAQPTAAAIAEAAKCQRRSPDRSELIPTSDITMIEQR